MGYQKSNPKSYTRNSLPHLVEQQCVMLEAIRGKFSLELDYCVCF